MKIDTIRIYAEVLEQGIDFKEYIENAGFNVQIINVYTKKDRGEFKSNDSVVDRIRKVKDADVLITAISDNQEYPLLMVEYSSAVPTDDHKMQRSDVYYWGAVFRAPIMKISPSAKGMEQNFGGGDNITDMQEQFIANRQGAVFYPIKWQTLPNSGVLPTKDNKLSCIPDNKEISAVVSGILKTFFSCSDYDSFYKTLYNLYNNYQITYSNALKITIDNVKSSIKNSTRFQWDKKKEKLRVKINRFGHAMDPDRGVLYYANMLVGVDNLISEIQVKRPIGGRGGYNQLFDGLSNESDLLSYVEDIIEDGNVFTDENALYVLEKALNISGKLKIDKKADHQYTISDASLANFLSTHPGIVSKTIFFLSTKLILTDVDRNVICSIEWNTKPIEDYLSAVQRVTNFTPIPIKPLENSDAKEDIITFASVELYKKMQCELLAVSYPGAQGDRCILTGEGRNVDRTYVDIIAYKRSSNGIDVFLEECKTDFSKSPKDVEKLNDIVKNKKDDLKALFKKVIQGGDINNIYLSIAAKQSRNIPLQDVDYAFMFKISSENNHTYIDYNVVKSSSKGGGGRLTFDEIFIIDR